MKRLLIVGAGANQLGIFAKAREMGVETVAMDGNAAAPGFAHADAAVHGNILDPSAVLDAARMYGVTGVYPAAELGVEAAAYAVEQLDLPGARPDVARCVRDKFAMREALSQAGVPCPGYRAVCTIEEAHAAIEAVGLPVIVKPSDGNASKGVQRVNTAEELEAAFSRALKRARRAVVLIESFMEGEEYNVDGLVADGDYRVGGLTAKDRSAPPNRFDLGIYMPPLIDAALNDAIVQAVADAFSAIGFRNGTTHAEVIVTEDGPRIVEMAGRPGGGRIPSDLIPVTYGMDFMADALRIALGEAPCESRHFERGTALYWVPAEPGVVETVEGLDEALALPGVREVVMSIQPGDTVEPIVNCATRDRIGYVFTEGDTVEDAIATAKRARDLCRVVTRP